MEVPENDLKRKLVAVAQIWRDRARQFEEHSCADVASTYRRAAGELESALDEWENGLLGVAEAALETGYSEEHLRRLVRKGRLPAERGNGRRSPIKLRRSELPRKRENRENKRGTKPTGTYDPEEDARSIAKHLEG